MVFFISVLGSELFNSLIRIFRIMVEKLGSSARVASGQCTKSLEYIRQIRKVKVVGFCFVKEMDCVFI